MPDPRRSFQRRRGEPWSGSGGFGVPGCLGTVVPAQVTVGCLSAGGEVLVGRNEASLKPSGAVPTAVSSWSGQRSQHVRPATHGSSHAS